MKSVFWRVAKRLSYIEDARRLNVNESVSPVSRSGHLAHRKIEPGIHCVGGLVLARRNKEPQLELQQLSSTHQSHLLVRLTLE